MDLDFEESKKCIWHAFDVLDEQNNGTVSRSKLKVRNPSHYICNVYIETQSIYVYILTININVSMLTGATSKWWCVEE